jgi:D-threo-aldose 1-dehydrogenase
MSSPVTAHTTTRARIAGLPAISPLSFGGAPVGNLFSSVDEASAVEAVLRAWNSNVRHFDTAPYYGFGLSETRLGLALSSVPRGSFTLSTKVGRLVEAQAGRSGKADAFAVDGQRAVFDYSRDGILRSVETSLRRLRTDHLDILLLHDIGELTHGAAHGSMLRQALEEALPAMAELRSQGVCSAIGIGVNEEQVCMEVMPRFALDVIMLAGRYTLFEQAHSQRVMARALADNVAILAAGPYNSGLLGRSDTPGDTYDYAPATDAIRARARQFYDVCAQVGADVGQMALQFPLGHPAVASVVCGMRSVAEVDASVARRDASVPARAWVRLREAGLIESGVPVPA